MSKTQNSKFYKTVILLGVGMEYREGIAWKS
jgi:hypothetical protein